MNCSKYETNLDLGNFVSKWADYEIYKNGEVFYRGMREESFELLCLNCVLEGRSEMFTSPTLEYIEAIGYGNNGAVVQFLVKHGTLDKLMDCGVKNDETRKMMEYFPKMLHVFEVKHWEKHHALFKTEGHKLNMTQINIGLGTGDALALFNENIVAFQRVK